MSFSYVKPRCASTRYGDELGVCSTGLYERHAGSPNRTAHPEFPERADLPHLSDQEAEAALALLRVLVEQDRASVYTRPYTPEGKRARWNVWDMTYATGRRVELEPWARGALAPRNAT